MATIQLYQRLALLALITSLLLTPHLWTGDHGLGKMPIVGWMALNSAIGMILYTAILIASVGLLARSESCWLRWILLGTLALATATDVNRFQVWLLHYVFILMLPVRLSKDEVHAAVVGMTSLTYAFSALHKINPSFRDEIFPWFTDTLHIQLETSWYLLMPLGELLVAVMLMSRGTGQVAQACAIGMHLVIMVVLLLRHWNYSVLPWNALLIIYHGLQLRCRPWTYTRDWRGLAAGGALAVPALLGLAGIVHESFSYRLYGGEQYAAIVVLSETCLQRVPTDVRALANRFKANGEPFIDLDRLSVQVTGAQRFQQRECFRIAARYFIRYAHDDNDIVLLIRRGNGMHIEKNLWVYTKEDIEK